jgi:hypothetical protein
MWAVNSHCCLMVELKLAFRCVDRHPDRNEFSLGKTEIVLDAQEMGKCW